VNGSRLLKRPGKHALSGLWHPFGRVLAQIHYRPPDSFEPIKKVIIEEFECCPAAKYTRVPSLMLQRVIKDWGNLTHWVQIDGVELAKRGWVWQAIESACQNLSAKINLEGDEYTTGLEARKGKKWRNAFRRHQRIPVRIIPSNRPVAPVGYKGSGYVVTRADTVGSRRSIMRARKARRLRKKYVKKKTHVHGA